MFPSNPRFLAATANCPYKVSWLYFYIYIRFPLGIILGAIRLLNSVMSGYLLASALYVLSLGITIVCYTQMRLFKSRAYILNIILLVFETLSSIFNACIEALSYWSLLPALLLSTLLFGGLWLLPNIIYFRKRRMCFCS